MSTTNGPWNVANVREANQALIRAFQEHEQFPVQQAQRRGKIYFMHDFASRTNDMLDSILNNTPPPDTPATRGSIPNVAPSSMTEDQKKELEMDALGRLTMLKILIYDTTGKSEMMFGEAPGQGMDVGDAVKRAADAVEAASRG